MKVLIVANYNSGSFSPFISEQVESLRRVGVEIDFFGVKGKGIVGYLSNLGLLKKKIDSFHPDLIHAHYGLSGLLANLQRKVPVVTTYHGSDIHSGGMILLLSKIAIRLSAYDIFVSKWLQKRSGYHGKKQCVLPCGVDFNTFFPMERKDARKQLGWDVDGKYILFAGSFDNEVKNGSLAKAAVSQMEDVHLVELQGYSREQVNVVMNAVNCLLMTSYREGSPQVVKEAMTCGTPVVSVDVGDVNYNMANVEGCFITSREVSDIVKSIEKALFFHGKTEGRKRIAELGFSNEQVSKRLLDIYDYVAKETSIL